MELTNDLERLIRMCLERKIPVRIQHGPKVADRYDGLIARYSPGKVAIRDQMGDFHEVDVEAIVKLEPQ